MFTNETITEHFIFKVAIVNPIMLINGDRVFQKLMYHDLDRNLIVRVSTKLLRS